MAVAGASVHNAVLAYHNLLQSGDMSSSYTCIDLCCLILYSLCLFQKLEVTAINNE